MASATSVRPVERAVVARSPKSAHRRRSDIQGLRAVAVVAVVLDHLAAWPRGGFVGVDVFFVISGFLITDLLLREYEATGTISFTGFYRRRIKRILPAALVVLVLTSAAAYLLFLGSRSLQIATDAVWALCFAANWRFALVGTDYFRSGTALSPLQHFWSLSVEEQFYFTWPWLMLAIFLVGARRAGWRRDRARRSASIAMAAIVVASLAQGFAETAANPTGAYFSTWSRGWELGLGALLAGLAPQLERIPSRLRPAMGWSGIVAIGGALAFTPSATGFPVPWALPAVAAAGLVIAAGTGGTGHGPRLLTNPVAGWIGDVSYSIYLWHFPVIVLLSAFFAEKTPAFYALAVLLLVLGAVGSYHLVENPVRRSAWLLTAAERARRPPAAPRRRQPLDPEMRSRLAWVAALAILLVGVDAVVFYRPGATFQDGAVATVANGVGQSSAPAGSSAALAAALRLQLQAAIGAADWPSPLDPAPDSLAGEHFAAEDADGCATANRAGKDCASITVRDPAKTVVVVGDSVAVAWLPAIRAAVEGRGWQVVALTMVGCPYLDTVSENSDPTLQAACPRQKQAVLDTLQRLHPALVIASSTYRITFADQATPAEQLRRTGLASIARRTEAVAGKFIALGAPPPTTNPQQCVTRLSGPASCLSSLPAYWQPQSSAELRAMAASGGTYIDPVTWFCAGGRCPAFVGHTMVKQDEVHITAQYARSLGPLLAAVLAEDGLIAS